VEFVALLLLACLALGALGAGAGHALDGRSYGGFLARHLVCAVRGCEEDRLIQAYGKRDAALVRAFAQGLVFEQGERQLPVDWRVCRRRGCAEAPDDRDLDAHLTAAGHRATAFTRVVRRRGRLYVEYWLYYPDSDTTLGPSKQLWSLVAGALGDYPGFHSDDWEGAVVRLRRGRAEVRVTSHGGFQGCKWRRCESRWVRTTGWVRVSRGSHSGHVPFRGERPLRASPQAGPRVYVPATGRLRRIALIPGAGLRERTATAEGLLLVPLETLDRRSYAPLDPDVRPPWRKDAYSDPESGES
jgi:hypothetical protein